MRVVATTGMPGSGKGLGVEVAEALDVPVVLMGDLVREETGGLEGEGGPRVFGEVASRVREEEGPGAWAKRTVERIDALEHDGVVLVDGVRSLDEVGVFREAYGDGLLVVAVLASPRTRYERLEKRGRIEDEGSVDWFKERDLRELGYGLGRVVAMADVYIVNEESPEEAKAMLRAVLGASGA